MNHRRRGVLTVSGALIVAGCAGDDGREPTERSPTDDPGETPACDPSDVDRPVPPDGTDIEGRPYPQKPETLDGERSLRIWNAGDYDDGVSWAVHPVPIEPGQAYDATVTGQFWSDSESFNTIRDAVVRLGPDRPETEEDFPAPGANTTELGVTPYGGLREPLWLADGWREYSCEWTTPQLETDTLSVAVGTSVIWEADATHYVDAVTVELAPR